MKNSYEMTLKYFPAKGGRNPYLIKVARAAICNNVSDHTYYSDIKSIAPDMTDTEILQAYRKAQRTCDVNFKSNTNWKPVEKNKAITSSVITSRLTDKFMGMGESELMDASKIKIDWEPGIKDAEAILGHLYKPNEYLYIGEAHGTGVKRVSDWVKYSYLINMPHIAPNPMTGQAAPQSGDPNKTTLRGDNCVARHIFAVAEMDGHSKEHQIAMIFGLMSVGFKIAAVIDSGGKSLHAWVGVNCLNANDWTTTVEQCLFDRYLVPMGVDRACKNEARLSRLPGHFRSEKGNYQRLIYLNPEAREIW